jgi:cytochrome c biogenesis protein CcdA
MSRIGIAGALASVTAAVVSPVVAHVRRVWDTPASDWPRALTRLLFTALLAIALNVGLALAIICLAIPGLSWFQVLLGVIAIIGPWVMLWGVLKAQRARLNDTCRSRRTAQGLLHLWLTVEIAGAMTTSFLPSLAPGWNGVSVVLAIIMGLALVFLPTFRRATLELWTPRAHVEIKRASRRASGAIFGSLWLWTYLSPMACPHRQCAAGGSHGLIWVLLFSLGTGWLLATMLVQLGSILRWLEDRSRNPVRRPA